MVTVISRKIFPLFLQKSRYQKFYYPLQDLTLTDRCRFWSGKEDFFIREVFWIYPHISNIYLYSTFYYNSHLHT
jgi:hypothetical protein